MRGDPLSADWSSCLFALCSTYAVMSSVCVCSSVSENAVRARSPLAERLDALMRAAVGLI